MPETHWYFKLFNSIKEEHEVDFTELELQSLFGNVARVKNFADIFDDTPFSNFRKTARIQDILAHELPYGEYHGFFAKTDSIIDVSPLVRRLAYVREFFVVTVSDNPNDILQKMFPEGEIGKNVQCFTDSGYSLLRFITNQYFLEKSQYISKLSRNEEEAFKNVGFLFSFLTKRLYRIPATATMQIGKRLEDYFTIREEPSLYLTHYMHPYKGKFHPKMVRALLNYVHPSFAGLVLDNMAGCGTLLVEATLLGIDNIGVEINPLSVLMSNVKCHSLAFQPEEFKKVLENYLEDLESATKVCNSLASGNLVLIQPKFDVHSIKRKEQTIPKNIISMLRDESILDNVLVAQELAMGIQREDYRDFILLAISGTISDLTRRRGGTFIGALRDRVFDLYLRIYIFNELNKILKIPLCKSRTFVADARNMTMIETESIDAIVTSPPYSTALDYIRNDLPQLGILELPCSSKLGPVDILKLEQDMIGNPNLRVYSDALLKEINDENPEYSHFPSIAKDTVQILLRYGRKKEALRTYKFFKDMHYSLKEMHRILKKGAKCAIIIGNNHYKLDSEYREVKNDEVLKQMAFTIGFREDKIIMRKLEKTKAGMIRYESILILEKT
jgi:site-specific DNA-methyltransferase (cytosine-N4-specific)